MTQVLFDGRKSITLDLNNEALWTSLGNGVPVSQDVRLYYERVGLLKRCVDIRANSLSKVPWVIANDAGDTIWKKGDTPPADLLFLKSLPQLLYKTEAALTLGSQAYWHKEHNRVRITGLRWFAPVATAPWWDEKQGLTHFVHNTGIHIKNYALEDMVYLWYQHPLHETMRDVSPAEAAMAAAGVLYNTDAFAAAFFERGAIKATLLTVQGNPPKTEMDRLKAWWSRVMVGMKNAFGAQVVNADSIKPVVIGEGISELSNSELTTEKERAVVYTLGVPFSMIFSDAANFATAGQDEQNFYNSTIIPDCQLIAEQLEEQLLGAYGYHLVFKPETMDIFQTDEADRAQSYAIYVGTGMPPELAGEMVGLDLPDGWTYADLKKEESPVVELPATVNGEPPMKDAPTDEDEDEPVVAKADPALAAEMRRFRAWARKRSHPDAAKFTSALLTRADKAAMLLEMGGGADQPFFTRARHLSLSLPDGAITPDAYKAMLLKLDPDDDEKEQKVRLEIERRFERELTGALQEQLTTLLPADASDDVIRSAVGQVEAASQPVREVLRRQLEQSASLGVTVALDSLERIGLSFDWTLAHTDAARWASNYSYELVRGINSTTAGRLQVAVDDWFKERTTLPDLVRELEPTFGRQRAKLVAPTEATRAAAEGSLAGWKEAGYGDERPSQAPPAHPGCRCWISLRFNDDGSVEFIWQTANDERRCPVCRGLHGTSLGFAKRAN